jgi:hypothetical protein
MNRYLKREIQSFVRQCLPEFCWPDNEVSIQYRVFSDSELAAKVVFYLFSKPCYSFKILVDDGLDCGEQTGYDSKVFGTTFKSSTFKSRNQEARERVINRISWDMRAHLFPQSA